MLIFGYAGVSFPLGYGFRSDMVLLRAWRWWFLVVMEECSSLNAATESLLNARRSSAAWLAKWPAAGYPPSSTAISGVEKQSWIPVPTPRSLLAAATPSILLQSLPPQGRRLPGRSGRSPSLNLTRTVPRLFPLFTWGYGGFRQVPAGSISVFIFSHLKLMKWTVVDLCGLCWIFFLSR